MVKLPRFFHVRNYVNGELQSRGGETFYVMPFSLPGYVEVSHARCSTKDNYSRKVGRTICVNRMSRYIGVHVLKEKEFFQGLRFNIVKRSNTRPRLYRRQRNG